MAVFSENYFSIYNTDDIVAEAQRRRSPLPWITDAKLPLRTALQTEGFDDAEDLVTDDFGRASAARNYGVTMLGGTPSTLAGVCSTSNLFLWHPLTGEALRREYLSPPCHSLYGWFISPHEPLIAWSDGQWLMWKYRYEHPEKDLASEREFQSAIAKLPEHFAVEGWKVLAEVVEIAFTKDGEHVVAVAIDDENQGQGFIYDRKLSETGSATQIERQGPIATFEPAGAVCAALSPTGEYLVTGSVEGKLQLWAIPSGRHLRTFDAFSHQVSAVAISPNGRYIVAGSSITTVPRRIHGSQSRGADRSKIKDADSVPGRIAVWDLEKGERVAQLPPHAGPIRDLEFSPDGRFLASAGEDYALRLYVPRVDIGKIEPREGTRIPTRRNGKPPLPEPHPGTDVRYDVENRQAR